MNSNYIDLPTRIKKDFSEINSNIVMDLYKTNKQYAELQNDVSVRNKNIALYRETIFEQVWQEPYLGNTRTIDLHIQRLKKKLDLGDAIETIYKVGYKFRAEKLK